MKRQATLLASSVSISACLIACGGEPFTDGGPAVDAGSSGNMINFDAAHAPAPDTGNNTPPTQVDSGMPDPVPHTDAAVHEDAGNVDAAILTDASGAVSDAGHPIVGDDAQAPSPEASTPPPPPTCGTAPSDGLWICFVLEHETSKGFIGFAGSNPPQGVPVGQYWNDPMIGSTGPCVASSRSLNVYWCRSAAVTGSMIQFAPGIHSTASGPTSVYACDTQSCLGTVVVSLDRTEIGAMRKGSVSGVLHQTAHYAPPSQMDLWFTVP